MRKQTRTAPAHALAALVGVSVLAATLTGCTGPAAAPGPQYLGICVDPRTGMRLDDSYCTPGGLDTMDYIDTYANPNVVLVPIGQREVFPRTVVIVHAVPAGRSSSISVPRAGGTSSTVRTALTKTSTGTSTKPAGSVTRGGLGVKGATSSGSSGGAPRVSAGS